MGVWPGGRMKVEWLEPWSSIDKSLGIRLVEELVRELPAAHPLHNVPVIAIARRSDCDDILFRPDDESGRVAVVHLTWRMAAEPDPRYPPCLTFATLDEWAERCMGADHREWLTGRPDLGTN